MDQAFCRHHLGFNQIFEAYSEGVVYLVASRRQGVVLHAITGGAKHGKTSDFATTTLPAVGLEVKTLNVFDPERTIDRTMDEGFEAGYAALEASRAKAKTGKTGVGIAEMCFAPHGEGVDHKGAVRQTVRKVKGNVKSGQYAARPTLLVISLVRLGVSQGLADLRRRRGVDEDCGEAPSGHLFAIAANRLEDSYFDRSHKWFGVRDTGPLDEAGVLLDHPYIAGLVYLETTWHKSGDLDAIDSGFRFYGVWNCDWEAEAFSADQRAEARRVFEQLCDAWNDTLDSQAEQIPDPEALYAAFLDTTGAFTQRWRGKTPDEASLSDCLLAADRAYFLWKAAQAGRLGAAADYTPPATDEVRTGHLEAGGEPVMFVHGAAADGVIPRLHLVKRGVKWESDDGLGRIREEAITV